MPLQPDEPKEWEFTIQTSEGDLPLKVRKIASSNVEWVGWPSTPGSADLLVVQFQGGARYIYFGVTRQKAVALANAKSTGVYLNTKIKKQHRCLKIR